MDGFDIHAALSVAKRFEGIARRADMFGHDRARLIEELIFAAEDYRKIADRIDEEMSKEAA